MTKIYGTLGPACNDENILYEMFSLGMTGLRINLSHTTLKNEKDNIEMVQSAAQRAGIKPELLMDMQGPELRIGNLRNSLLLKDGQEISVDELLLPIEIGPYLNKGQELLLDDGKILAEIISNDKVLIKRGGELLGRKSVALPGATVNNPPLTHNDLDNISCASQIGITGLMQPFVRNRDDLESVKNALAEYKCTDVKIFAKIENNDGVSNLKELIPACDEIVIARGDLGNAVPLWKLPAIQKNISAECKKSGRKFMVVTQMLSSMEKNSVPTRAEVSDIFNAVVDGAASVMVTGETATGKYPVDVIKYLANTVKEAELYLSERM